MATYENTSGNGTPDDDTYLFDRQLPSYPNSMPPANAGAGIDTLIFNTSYSLYGVRMSVSQTDTGGFNARVVDGPFGSDLSAYNFEQFIFTGGDTADFFEFTFANLPLGKPVTYEGGGHLDTLTIDVRQSSAGLDFVVQNGVINANFGEFTGIEKFIVRGGSGNDNIETGDFDDQVISGLGNDTVRTGGGADHIYSNSLTGSVDGGAGVDFWEANFSSSTTALTVDLGETVAVSSGFIATNVEAVRLYTGSGDDTINLNRGGSSVTISAGDGADLLTSSAELGVPQAFVVQGGSEGLTGIVNEADFSQIEQVIFNGGSLNDQFEVTGTYSSGQISFHGGGGTDSLRANFYPLGGATQFIVAADGTIVSNRGEFVSLEVFTLFGSPGNDTITTGPGDDFISGDTGDDVLTGGAGNDLLIGTAGYDILRGGSGDDTYSLYTIGDDLGDLIVEEAGEGYDRVYTRFSYSLAPGTHVEELTTESDYNQNINLAGNEYDNLIRGTGGANALDGGGGSDTLIGGSGNDVYFVDRASDVVIEALLSGQDRVVASASYVLDASASVETLETATYTGINSIDLTGNGFANLILGNNGINRLDGGGGADRLHGYAGNDYLVGGAGFDNLYGGAGDDRYYIGSADGDRVWEFAGEGYDTASTEVDYILPDVAHVEQLEAGTLTATIPLYLGGSNLSNLIIGNAGNNTLRGFAGNDTLHGLDGDDVLIGDEGADVMYGGIGNDTYYVNTSDDRIFESAGEGSIDRVATEVSFTLPGEAEVEVLEAINLTGTSIGELGGSQYANAITGDAGNNVLRGYGGNDTLNGYLGNDVLIGDEGADTMAGGAGDDVYYVDIDADLVIEAHDEGNDRVSSTGSYALAAGAEVEILEATSPGATYALSLSGSNSNNLVIGNNGANWIDGKGGDDVLIGLGGQDTFVFSTGLGSGNIDRIEGFETGTDRIALDDAVFAAVQPGALGAGAFFVGSQAGDGDDRIIYDQSTGALYYDPDGTGAAAQIQLATLSGSPTLGGGDFLLV